MKYDIKQGDCLELMKDIPDGSIDLVITDPPYGIGLTPQRITGKFKGTIVLNDDNLEWLDNWIEEIYRISKNIVWCFRNCVCFALFPLALLLYIVFTEQYCCVHCLSEYIGIPVTILGDFV